MFRVGAADQHFGAVGGDLPEEKKLRALAMWLNGRFVDNYEYYLEGTPCAPVVENLKLTHIPENIIELFPGDTFLGPIRIETPVANAANGRFLLKSVPMTSAEARALCTRLEALRQECMVVNR